MDYDTCITKDTRTLTIVKAYNGFLLIMRDSNGKELGGAMATSDLPRSYDQHSLVNCIERLYTLTDPAPVAEPSPAMRELITHMADANTVDINGIDDNDLPI